MTQKDIAAIAHKYFGSVGTNHEVVITADRSLSGAKQRKLLEAYAKQHGLPAPRTSKTSHRPRIVITQVPS